MVVLSALSIGWVSRCVPNCKLINATPHPISIYSGGETPLVLSPSGTVARVVLRTFDGPVLMVRGHDIDVVDVRRTGGEVSGLPEPLDGGFVVVSRMVAEALPDRVDLLVPHELVRDEGRVVGCQSLARLVP